MGKIVRDGDAVEIAEDFKTAVCAGKAREAFCDFFSRNAADVRCCGCSQRIVNVVVARYRERNFRQRFAVLQEGEALTGFFGFLNGNRPVVAGFFDTEGADFGVPL